MSATDRFCVRRQKNGLPLKPENQTFATRMLAIEHAETLDLRADESVQVLEGANVAWTRHAK
jgi:hypothetical protein